MKDKCFIYYGNPCIIGRGERGGHSGWWRRGKGSASHEDARAGWGVTRHSG